MLDDSKGINFNSPVYAGTFRRNWEFEQYKNDEHYWLELDYYIMRDTWAAHRKPYGTQLDLDILDGAGNPVFKDISTAERALLASRNYRLINAAKEIASKNEAVYKVTELYGYPPSANGNPISFEYPTSEVAPYFGMDDPAGYLKVSGRMGSAAYGIEYDEGAEVFSIFFNTPGDYVKFSTGDMIRVNFPPAGSYYEISCPEVEITAIGEGYIRTSAFTGQYVGSSGTASSVNIRNFSKIRPWTIERRFLKRAFTNRVQSVTNVITYHETKPDEEERFYPKFGTGVESEIITEATSPTPEEWKEEIENGGRFLAFDSEIEQIHTLWKKRLKYVSCK